MMESRRTPQQRISLNMTCLSIRKRSSFRSSVSDHLMEHLESMLNKCNPEFKGASQSYLKEQVKS